MEPERRIEKWLRAFAKKRREQAGAPMELRPATRERLQREIARQSGEKTRGGFFSSLFFSLRPGLVFAACFAALVLGTLVLWPALNHPKSRELSMNKSSDLEPGSAPAAPETPPPAVMSPTVANADKKVLEQEPQSRPIAPQPGSPAIASANRSLATPPAETAKERDRGESAFQQKQLTVTTAAAPSTTNLSLAFKNEAAAGSLASANTLTKDTETTPPSISAPLADNFIAGNNTQQLKSTLALQSASAVNGATNTLFDLAKATGAATVSQLFNRVNPASTRRIATDTQKNPAPVLTSFRVEQTGNNLKVVDADGSVYTGAVQIAQQEPYGDHAFAAAKNGSIGAARAAKTPAPVPQNYFFRVAGTNRNLNANVVFSGNFVPFTNNQLAAGTRSFGGFGGGGGGGGAGGQLAGSDQSAAQPVQAILSNSQITGNVIIGNQKPVNVIATPAH